MKIFLQKAEEDPYELFTKALQDLNAEDAKTVSEESAGMQGEEYYIKYNGKRQLMKKHIKSGTSRDKRYLFRLYYFWDDDDEKVVICSLPGHLRTRQS